MNTGYCGGKNKEFNYFAAFLLALNLGDNFEYYYCTNWEVYTE